MDALDTGAGELRLDHHARQHPGRTGQHRHVSGEGDEGAEGDLVLQHHPATEAEHPHLSSGGQRGQTRRGRRGHPGGAQPFREQPPRTAFQPTDLPVLLAEALHDPDTGDGFLDVLRDVRCSLLGRPRRRE